MSQDSKYQKQRLIGSGERVDVYLGLNVAFGRKVAIKELRGGVDSSVHDRNSFFGEYEKWAKLEHPRLCRIEDLDKTRAWVIQEYLPQSIIEIANGFSNIPAGAYGVLEQILEGLAFLHQSGVIHFNLKSSNIRGTADSIKLCDGRCVPIGYPGSLPKPRGSNCYLAPEMINEEFGSVGTATDIYVAGMIMLEALAGAQFESLFKGYVLGTPDTEVGWVRWHNSPETLDPLATTLPHIPAPLATVIEGMICKQVAIRYASADRLLQDLRSNREAILAAKSDVPPSRPELVRNDTAGVAPQPPGSAGFAPAAPGAPAHAPADAKIKLIDRPHSPTYVRCLSGTLAGTLFPASMGEILIGDGSQCNVRIPADHYPVIAGREIKIWLGNNGWQISDSLNHPIIVDSKQSFQATNLRSGSVFRLSPRGPDFQFVVQGQHEATWQDIASELELLSTESTVPERLLKKKSKSAKSSADAPAPVKPLAAVGAAPNKPQLSAPGKPPVAAPAPPPAPRAASPASSPATPAAPSRPFGAAPAAPTQAVAEPDAKAPMDKNKRNNLILFISLPIIAILIILFMPRASAPEPKEKAKTDEVKSSDDAAKEDDPSQNTPDKEETEREPAVEEGSAAEPSESSTENASPATAENPSDSSVNKP